MHVEREAPNMWPECLGLLLVSVSALDASQRGVTVDAALNRTFQDGFRAVSGARSQVTPVTENLGLRRIDVHLHEHSGNTVEGDVMMRPVTRRRRLNKMHNGLSNLCCFYIHQPCRPICALHLRVRYECCRASCFWHKMGPRHAAILRATAVPVSAQYCDVIRCPVAVAVTGC